jgi:hypothetical protein
MNNRLNNNNSIIINMNKIRNSCNNKMRNSLIRINNRLNSNINKSIAKNNTNLTIRIYQIMNKINFWNKNNKQNVKIK